jgi:hypothetical protein
LCILHHKILPNSFRGWLSHPFPFRNAEISDTEIYIRIQNQCFYILLLSCAKAELQNTTES